MADLSVRDLLDRLASREPAPGGGSASALTGALGAALVEMVCALTAGRAEYAEVDPMIRQLAAAAADLRTALTAAAEEDADAYGAVVAARRLPRETDDQRAVRSPAVIEATVLATEVPLRVARLGSEVLDLALAVAPIGNRHAISDAGVAAALAAAAVRGAALNVRINLPSLPAEHPLRATAAETLDQLEATLAPREQAVAEAVATRMPG